MIVTNYIKLFDGLEFNWMETRFILKHQNIFNLWKLYKKFFIGMNITRITSHFLTLITVLEKMFLQDTVQH